MVVEVPEVPTVPANKNLFTKIESLEVLVVPKVPDLILIYESIYKSIFKRTSKFRGSRGSKSSKGSSE